MKIALDFDGVLSHSMKRWVEIQNQTFKRKKITLRDVDVWAFYEKFGMTKEECFKIFDKVWGDWTKLIPMEHDLQQKTKMLSKLGEVDIVTTVIEGWIPNITKWLDRENISYNSVVHSEAKHELDYDIYIDDAVKNAEKMLDSGKTVLLYNQPWNHYYGDTYFQKGTGGELYRIYNLYHAIDKINWIQRGKLI